MMGLPFLTIFITLKCTHNCIHCLYACSPDRIESISIDIFKKGLEIARKHKITTINFFGGEPLLHPFIFEMLEITLRKNFNIIFNTNCKQFEDYDLYKSFESCTTNYKEKILINSSNDKYHLKFFDPQPIIFKLKNRGYFVNCNNYADNSILISDHNQANKSLFVNTDFSCCGGNAIMSPAIMTGGGWSICAPSLTKFGSIDTVDLDQILNFINTLNLKKGISCTECLAQFSKFKNSFLSYLKKNMF